MGKQSNRLLTGVEGVAGAWDGWPAEFLVLSAGMLA